MGPIADKKRLIEIARGLQLGRVLVVGDVMLDQFIYGTVERISPEAPVPVVKVDQSIFRLGGGANVAANLSALGGKVDLCGVVGKDMGGAQIERICREQGIGTEGLVESAQRQTSLKTRIIAGHQQVVRFDQEVTTPLPKRLVSRLLQHLGPLVEKADAVIVSDYGKGVIGKVLLDEFRKLRKTTGRFIAVDPKVGNYRYYRQMSLMTPNHHEAGQILGKRIPNTDEAVVKAGSALLKKLNLDSLIITRGEGGMTLFKGRNEYVHIPTRARQVFDVTGAGDTVIATLTLAMACGASLMEAAEVANYAAGVVVGKLGTATTNPAELINAIRRGFP